MAVYRPKYGDPKTGKLIQSEIWWCNFRFSGKRYRESTMSTRKKAASEYERNRRLEIERQYAGLAAEQSAKDRIRTVSEALKAYKAGYKVKRREKSQAWVGERSSQLERLLGNSVRLDLTEKWVREYRSAARLPGVVEDLIEDAKSKDDVCDRCDGIGSVAAPPGLAGNIPGYRLAREASEEHGAIYTVRVPNAPVRGPYAAREVLTPGTG